MCKEVQPSCFQPKCETCPIRNSCARFVEPRVIPTIIWPYPSWPDLPSQPTETICQDSFVVTLDNRSSGCTIP